MLSPSYIVQLHHGCRHSPGPAEKTAERHPITNTDEAQCAEKEPHRETISKWVQHPWQGIPHPLLCNQLLPDSALHSTVVRDLEMPRTRELLHLIVTCAAKNTTPLGKVGYSTPQCISREHPPTYIACRRGKVKLLYHNLHVTSEITPDGSAPRLLFALPRRSAYHELRCLAGSHSINTPGSRRAQATSLRVSL